VHELIRKRDIEREKKKEKKNIEIGNYFLELPCVVAITSISSAILITHSFGI